MNFPQKDQQAAASCRRSTRARPFFAEFVVDDCTSRPGSLQLLARRDFTACRRVY